MRDGFLLHRGVHDHPLQLGRLDSLDFNRRLDGGFEQLLQAFFADGAAWTWGFAKAADLGGVTG